MEGTGGEASAGQAVQGDKTQTSPAGSAEVCAGRPRSVTFLLLEAECDLEFAKQVEQDSELTWNKNR